jgi:hypothetical protein
VPEETRTVCPSGARFAFTGAGGESVIDTVGLSCQVDGLDVGDLERRGWDTSVRRVHRGGEVQEHVKAFANLGNGAALEYFATAGVLTVRASLPKALGYTNDVVLSWADTAKALFVVTGGFASELAGQTLPAADSWGLWRFDPVWAWGCDPAPYLDALRMARLARTQTVCEPGSVRWRSLRSGSIFGRMYDKSKEAGRTVPLPCRLEREVRPKRQTLRVDGDPVGGSVSDLSEAVCLGVIGDTLTRLGLDRPIPSVMASRRVLTGACGRRKGDNLWRELLTFQACSGWPADYSTAKVRRIERDCRRAGIGALSLDGTLPALRIEQPSSV